MKKALRVGIAAAGTGLAIGATTMFPDTFKSNVVKPIIEWVGDLAGVNTAVDNSYRDFHIVGLEIAKRGGNVEASEWKHIKDSEPRYLLTAVREDQGALIGRTFLVTKSQLLNKLEVSQEQLDEVNRRGLGTSGVTKDSKVLFPDRKFSFGTKGQYLRTSTSLLDFRVYPRVETVVVEPSDRKKVARVNEGLKRGVIDSSFRTQKTFDPN